jgi:hypothetical protein
MNVTTEDCKANLKVFTWLVWKHLGLPQPTDVQIDIMDYLQNGGDRLIIEAFRGVGKSYLTSVYVLWRLLNDPTEKFLIVSASKIRSDEFSIFTKRLLSEMPILSSLRGGLRDSNVAFDVAGSGASHAPSVKAVGISGQLTGSRATEIIADDIEIISNSMTNDLREKLIHRCGEFESVLVPGGKIKYLGTPQSYETIYNKLATRGYKLRVWPARVPSEDLVENYNGCLAPMVVDMIEKGVAEGTAVDPKRFDDEDLLEREANMGRSTFTLQFMLDTTLSDSDKFPLKLADLMIMSVNPEQGPSNIQWASGKDQEIPELPLLGMSGDRWHKPMFISTEWYDYQGTTMAIDPSGRGNDETGYCVVKHLHGRLYVTALGGLRGGYDDKTLKQLAMLAKEHKVNKVVLEDNFGNGMYTKLITPHLSRIHPCTIEEVTNRTQKELRIIETLEPVLSGHRLIIDKAIIEQDVKRAQDPRDYNHSFAYQFTRLTRDRNSLQHDDLIDVLAIAVKDYQDSMAIDFRGAEEEAKLDWTIKEMEKSMAFLKGEKYDDNNLSWI